MKKYKVIWFDDEHETLEIIREKAAIAGIRLVGFSNAVEGLSDLEKNIFFYDAVIVDGKFYKTPGQSGDAVDDSAFVTVARKLDALSNKKIIPWFILSGQASFTKEQNPFALQYKDNKVYDKNIDADFDTLWNDIKVAADSQTDTQIRHEYERVFEVFSAKYIESGTHIYLLDILKSLKSQQPFDYKLYFSQLRLILESMFRAANKYGFLHDKCIDKKGEVNLSESSLFLAGEPTKHLGVKCSISHFNKIIADHVKSIVFLTGAAAHTVDPDSERNRLNLEEYLKIVNSPYLLYSLSFKLMDVLLWFKDYADRYPDYSKNIALWCSTTEECSVSDAYFSGIVINMNTKGFAFFKPDNGSQNAFIPHVLVNKYSLSENQGIKVRYISKEKGLEVVEIKTND